MKPSIFDIKLAQALSWVVGGILVLLPFHALATTWMASNVGHYDLIRAWKEVLLILALPAVLWLTWRSSKLRRYLFNSWTVRLLAIYIALHLVLGLYALQTGVVNIESLIYSYTVNLRFLGFFVMVLVSASYSSILSRNWTKILLFPATIVVIFGIAQKFLLPYDFLRHFGYGLNTIPAYQTVDSQFELRRVQSTLRGANPLGAYLLLVTSAYVVIVRKNRTKLLFGLAALLTILFYSYSRSAWLGLVLSLSFFAGFSASRRFNLGRMVFVYIATALLVGVGLYALRYNNTVQDTVFHTSSESTSEQSSNEVRAQALKQGASDIVSEPLGRGPGTAGPASFRNDSLPRISENYYFQIGQELGVAGMLVFIAINLLVARQLWEKRSQQLAKILLISLAGITVVNLVSHAWADDTLSYIWWGLAGIALTPAILTDRHKQNGKANKSQT
ncbi:O-antigen ligase family protein [Candidatus Saccharibacteria bacterium]|nr:O-antigen ligase family protein [Candidatus Saccharibacteria bacterium]